MNNVKYYKKVIKPIEKKYNNLCSLYSFIKLKCIQNNITYYSSILKLYYTYVTRKKDIINDLFNLN